jgi:hypothetical protein
VVGFGLWSTALVLVYALHAIGCAYHWGPGAIRLVIGAVVVGHVIAIGLCMRYLRPAAGTSLLLRAAQWTLIAALVATLFTYGPLVLLSPCV